MFPPYLFAYAETLRAEPAVGHLDRLAREQGAQLWITGGTLRDVLLTRWPRDLDLAVLGDVEALGRAVARKVRGKYVALDPDTGTARVAIRSTQGIDWLDLVALRAPTIEEDLSARDFTVNAIALPLEGVLAGDADFIDPTGGRDDLHGQRLRMTSEAALTDDPLRILRAYRFEARLGFAVEPDTRAALARHARLSARPAGERLHHELSRLLEAPDPAPVLAHMMEDGVLGAVCPELGATVGVAQDGHHHLPVWEHTVETLARLTDLLSPPGPEGPPAAAEWAAAPGNREVLHWAALFHDVGKPPCRVEAEGRTRFHGHDVAGAQLFEVIAMRLRLPGKKARRVARLVRHHLRPLHLLDPFRKNELTLRAVDRLCRDLGDDLPALFLLARADARASRGPLAAPDADKMVGELFAHVEAVREARIRPLEGARPLLTGTDLVRRFGLAPGKRVGELLEALREARLNGDISDRAGAEAWLKARLAADEEETGDPEAP
jgi:poly(A) polymerase